MQSVNTLLSALLPIFGVIVLGYVLRRRDFPGEAFWPLAERLTYFVLFPALLFRHTATAEMDAATMGPLVGALVLATLAMAVMLLIAERLLRIDGPAFTSVFQGSIRFNTFVGLSAAFALWGEAGLDMAAIIIAVLIPLLNILCVAVLVHFAYGNTSWKDTLANLIKNPLLIACASGAGYNLAGLPLPLVADHALDILGRASLPIGLLAVGAALQLSVTGRQTRTLASVSVIKLFGFPLVTWGACVMLSVPPLATATAILFAALPGSPASYILARQLGGDSALIAKLITVQTVLAAMSLPLVLYLGQTGL